MSSYRSTWFLACLIAFSAPAIAQTTKPSTVVLPASLEAFESADQFAKVSGYVTKVNADIGDHLKQGQVLAEIDAPELEQDVAEARAVLQAKAQMLKASDASVLQSEKMQEVAKSQLGSAQVERDLAEVTLKRQQELFAGKAITDQQLDDVKAKAATTAASTAVAQARIAAAKADVVAAQANRAVAAAQLDVARAQVQKAQAILNYTKIVAPFDGVITRRIVNRGDLVPAVMANRAMPLFTYQRVDMIRIFCEVPETSVGGIVVGTPAEIKLYTSGMPPVHGSVTRIAGALDPQTRTMRIEIDVPNPQEKLRPGMYAEVTLTPGAAKVAEVGLH